MNIGEVTLRDTDKNERMPIDTRMSKLASMLAGLEEMSDTIFGGICNELEKGEERREIGCTLEEKVEHCLMLATSSLRQMEKISHALFGKTAPLGGVPMKMSAEASEKRRY